MSNSYKQQKSFEDIKSAEDLESVIEDLVIKLMKKHNKDGRHYSAKIISVSGERANIAMFDSDLIVQNVKVREGLTVSENMEVYILAINGSVNNLLVDFSK